MDSVFDEIMARRMRRELGRDGCLVSWSRTPNGTYAARLSRVRGETYEGHGEDAPAAILAARRAMAMGEVGR